MLDNWRIPKYNSNTEGQKRYNKKCANEKKIKLEIIQELFKDCADLHYKPVIIGKEEFTLVYIENMVDKKVIDNYILKPLINGNNKPSKVDNDDVFTQIEKGLVSHISSTMETDLQEIVKHILNGHISLISKKNKKKAVSFNVKKVEKRSVTEPSNENIIKGAKETFIENVKVNLGLVRNRLKTTELKVKELKVGKESTTTLEVIYLENAVDKKVLAELLKRINNIQTENLIALADFEEQLVEKKYSIFPQLLYTEKTDKFVGNIAEGKIGILIDGVPIAYIVPALFNMFFQASEDYSVNYAVTSVLRVFRYLCMFLTIIFPAFFVSVCVFHQEMIPTDLALSIIQSKQGEPFPVLIEVIFMLVAFEILIEASARLPKTIGQTISIVGRINNWRSSSKC